MDVLRIAILLIVAICSARSSLLHLDNVFEFESIVNGSVNVLVHFRNHCDGQDDCIAEFLHYSQLQKIAQIFAEDSKKILVADSKAEIISDILWRDSLRTSNNETIAQLISKPFPRLVLFKANKENRECLLELATTLKFSSYEDQPNLQQVVNFVNKNCGTFRNIDGELSREHQIRSKILETLFDPRKETSSECERISDPSPEFFFMNYVLKSKPVIITNALNEWPALTKWTNEYLRNRFSDYSVNIKVTPDGEFEGCEDIKLWEGHEKAIPETVRQKLLVEDMVVVRPADVRMKFWQFMDLLYSDLNASFYLEYTSIKSVLPEMLQDIRNLSFANFFHTAMTNVWLGNGKTLGKLHFDPFDNLMAMISGKKEFIIYDPHHNEDLYEGHIREGELDYDIQTNTFYRKNLIQSTSMVMSPVDIKKPNLERFPLFSNAKQYRCVVSSNEVLYLPSFWWHEVQSYPDDDKRNLAVNFWYEPFLDKEFPCNNCRQFVSEKYDHIITDFNLYSYFDKQ